MGKLSEAALAEERERRRLEIKKLQDYYVRAVMRSLCAKYFE